jgi:uncharacterized membrane protein HdeD (DUF308 family)
MRSAELGSNSKDSLSTSFVSLVDTIFGVILAEGFVVYQTNILDPTLSPFIDFSLLLAYATIILSWIGYHRSVEIYEYKANRWSRLHLALDISIVVLYAYLIFAAQTLSRMILGLFLVFIFYTVTGIVRIAEWKSRKAGHPELTMAIALGFLFEWFLSVKVKDGALSWSLLVFAFILVFGYRWIRGKFYPPAKVSKRR